MQTNDFEKAFGDFLDRREYDQAENALFAMVRIAFLAGWKAAGGLDARVDCVGDARAGFRAVHDQSERAQPRRRKRK